MLGERNSTTTCPMCGDDIDVVFIDDADDYRRWTNAYIPDLEFRSKESCQCVLTPECEEQLLADVLDDDYRHG